MNHIKIKRTEKQILRLLDRLMPGDTLDLSKAAAFYQKRAAIAVLVAPEVVEESGPNRYRLRGEFRNFYHSGIRGRLETDPRKSSDAAADGLLSLAEFYRDTSIIEVTPLRASSPNAHETELWGETAKAWHKLRRRAQPTFESCTYDMGPNGTLIPSRAKSTHAVELGVEFDLESSSPRIRIVIEGIVAIAPLRRAWIHKRRKSSQDQHRELVGHLLDSIARELRILFGVQNRRSARRKQWHAEPAPFAPSQNQVELKHREKFLKSGQAMESFTYQMRRDGRLVPSDSPATDDLELRIEFPPATEGCRACISVEDGVAVATLFLSWAQKHGNPSMHGKIALQLLQDIRKELRIAFGIQLRSRGRPQESITERTAYLHDYEGKSFGEIAKVLGEPDGEDNKQAVDLLKRDPLIELSRKSRTGELKELAIGRNRKRNKNYYVSLRKRASR